MLTVNARPACGQHCLQRYPVIVVPATEIVQERVQISHQGSELRPGGSVPRPGEVKVLAGSSCEPRSLVGIDVGLTPPDFAMTERAIA